MDAALQRPAHGLVRTLVQKVDAGDRGPERAVRRLGGRVTRDLPLIRGFAASVPGSAVRALAATPGVRVVSLDRGVQVDGTLRGTGSSTLKSVYPQVVRADSLWTSKITGKGVTVALVDTGVASVADLAGRILPVTDDLTSTTSACENLSGEAGCEDSYGHGTFVAGIIAGNGAASKGAWKGIAPAANIVSVKIAGRDGSSDVSTVIAGIQWVVSFKSRYNIRVLNLSLGTDSTQSYRVDPLNYAVERAWAAGIAVVVSAANRGPGPKTIAKPGDDPFVMTVAATDDRGTVGLGDDQLPNFSSRGPTSADGIAKPDLAAPGAHIVSLRSPGSTIDTQFPASIDGAYHRGSGTSFGAGVVSGAAALVLQANPSMTPDRLKFALSSTARRDASTDPLAVGAGCIDAYSAALRAPAGTANQGLSRSSGLGPLDASRGDLIVRANDLASTVVQGEETAQLLAWDPVGLTTGDWTASGWYASTWYLAPWLGTRWVDPAGDNWHGDNWHGSTFYGEPDPGSQYGSPWDGSTWYGAWG